MKANPTSMLYFCLLFSLPACFTSSRARQLHQNGKYQILKLKSAVGPESFAFDCNGEGPYTGVSDGRILKWQGPIHAWTEFAVTSHNRSRDLCDGSNDPSLEPICGRPLGLQFNKKTCDLYIADAYFGLLLVGPKGGVATPLVSSAEGLPFRFTNALDIDQENGLVYFTDSSINFGRSEFLLLVLTADKTGRLMKYNLQSKQVTVLLRGVEFANGVALSQDKSYILVAETTKSRILRYWLQGDKAGTSELFAQFTVYPDNIKRNDKGEFWVGLSNGQGKLKKAIITSTKIQESEMGLPRKVKTLYADDAVAVRLDKEGNVLEVLRSRSGQKLDSVSEVEEINGRLWIGSVIMPYACLSKVT